MALLAMIQNVQAPSPPAPTPAPGGPAQLAAPTVESGLITTVPQTVAEVQALRAQRSELSSQLTSAVRRREGLAGDLDGTSGANRAGIESRITLLDQRILQIERDISTTGQLISRAPGQYLQGDPSPSGPTFMRVDMTAILTVFTIFVLMPLAVSYARNLWRRGSMPKVDDQLARENSSRLERLETAVDSIAIEMERVSEGQRFVTKLLSETRAPEKVRIEAPRD
jgi:hypothetical protein